MLIYDNLNKKCSVIKSRITSDNDIDIFVRFNDDAVDIIQKLQNEIIDPKTYLNPPYAPDDEVIIFGYGYGNGTVKSPIRDTDDFDETFILRPWHRIGFSNLLDSNKILYHNTWKHVEFKFNYKDNFRFYVKYGNGDTGCYIKNILIDGNEYRYETDLNATTVERDGEIVVLLPPDWSKAFLIEDGTLISDGEHTVSFDYYVDDHNGYSDLPDELPSIHGIISVENFDISDEIWMNGVSFDSAQDMQEAKQMGQQEYLKSLPETNRRLSEQVTALELALVELYEGGL